MDDFMPDPSPREELELSILATVPQPAKFAAVVAVFRAGFGRGAAWNWILLGAHESEPLKNA